MTGRLRSDYQKWDHDRLQELFFRYQRHGDVEARDELILAFMDLVRFLAAKFAHRGEPVEDLVQVGAVALIRAIDRYDPSKGVEFSTFVTPTVLGEIRRHFRDRGWALKVPRKLKELSVSLAGVVDRLSSRFERAPTIQEIAHERGVTEEDVIEAQELGRVQNILSFTHELNGGDEKAPSQFIEYLGAEDARLERVENSLLLNEAFTCLEPSERGVLYLRYYENLTQSSIAKIFGLSQMQISRIQQRAMEKLRQFLVEKQGA